MLTSATPLSAIKAGPIDQIAALLKAAAEPLRLDILRLLGQSSFGVLELAFMLDVSQPGMSHHLKVLMKAGWVETRREGNSVFYRRCLPQATLPGAAVVPQLLATIDMLPLPVALEQKLDQVQEQRAAKSRAFFSRNAEQLRSNQDLIAEHDIYDEPAWQLLQRACRGNTGKALEIGPGDGGFLWRLATTFSRVLGLEYAPERVAGLVRQRDQAAFDHVVIQQGEWPRVVVDDDWDAVAFNMVLHHLPTPARSIAAAAQVLRRGGVLLITELCRHQQDWARQRCGDLWLGFDEAELMEWCQRAGLVFNESQFLAQKNGFQVQLLSFYRS